MTTDSPGWRWFPWGVLRSAGFPIRSVEPLGSEALVLAADSLIDSDRGVAGAAQGVANHLPAVATRPQRRRMERAIHSRRAIASEAGDESTASCVRNWNAMLERRARDTEEFNRAYEHERVDSTERLLRVLDQDGIRRAILWQNRRVVPFLLKAKDSWDERTLLKYLSRYAAKNDTIGFFGPVAWIRLSSEHGHGTLLWGPAVTRATLLSFETWPIGVIAERLAEDVTIRPWLAPRRAALCRLQNHRVFMPPDHELAATDREVEVLRLCDGRHTAREIAKQLALVDLGALEHLYQAGLITWTLDCPLRTNPELAIEELAARIDDREIRTAVQSHSTWLGSVTTRLRAGMDTSASLAAILAEADAEFEHRYSRQAVQSSGQYYAGRTLTYIDCERDVSLTLNADLLKALMQGVSPILLSLRWYTYTIAQQLISPLAELVPAGQTRPLADIFPHTLSLVLTAVHDAAERYRQKWQSVLAVDSRQRIVRLDAGGLAAVVATEFPAPHPGWPMARVHNPDILIAACNDAELARGECTLVLGEIHASLPSMFQSAIFSMCPEPERVRDMYHALVPAPPVINEVSQRLNLGDFFGNAAQLLLPDDPVTHVNVRPIADFEVHHADAGLWIRDVMTGEIWSFPAFFDALLSRATFQVDPFDQPDDIHSPRILIDDLVVAREKWRLSADVIGIVDRRRADPDDPGRHFLAVRRWARHNEVPRYVFAKSAKEAKPIFLDLESQKCVELLCHLLKQAAGGDAPHHVTISEMLPEPERCWLRDGAGDRYTSELRLLAVDPEPYPRDRQDAF